VCHLRFDDTNPEKEEQEYVDGIIDAVKWLGFNWQSNGSEHLFFASDYFGVMYDCALALIQAGHAYVDEQSPEQMRTMRGTLTEAGQNSPWRERPASDSTRLLNEMREGKHADGSMALRAKIDMASPNINLRDPVLYRIRHATHHRTGNQWCVCAARWVQAHQAGIAAPLVLEATHESLLNYLPLETLKRYEFKN
jgi:glutaminyl-tRNA synthetase